eukprot:2547476-Pleurochrysis_carterae.AAC.1
MQKCRCAFPFVGERSRRQRRGIRPLQRKEHAQPPRVFAGATARIAESIRTIITALAAHKAAVQPIHPTTVNRPAAIRARSLSLWTLSGRLISMSQDCPEK